jgi:transcriptional regulator with XRE-family HTH domain
MKLTGRKIQIWRQRLNIKQADLADYVCIPQTSLQRIENKQYVPDTEEILGFLNVAMAYFDKTPIADIVVDAVKRNVSTHGFVAGLQTLTDTDTTTEFYAAKIRQAKSHMRIADSLRFRKNALAGEKLYTLLFDKGRDMELWGNAFTIAAHYEKYYGDRKVVRIVHAEEATA